MNMTVCSLMDLSCCKITPTASQKTCNDVYFSVFISSTHLNGCLPLSSAPWPWLWLLQKHQIPAGIGLLGDWVGQWTGRGSNPDGDKTETDAFRALLHQSRRGSQRPDRQPLGKAAWTQPHQLGDIAQRNSSRVRYNVFGFWHVKAELRAYYRYFCFVSAVRFGVCESVYESNTWAECGQESLALE